MNTIATPGAPFIQVAGNLIVRVESNPFPGLAQLLAEPMRRTVSADRPPADLDACAPRKILADGTEVPATDPRSDHVAVLFPDTGWMIAVEALSASGKPLSTQQDAEAAGKALTLLGHDDWTLAPDKVYERHVIDRRYHEPTADKNLYPNLPLSDWYWTSTIAPWSAESAFYVYLPFGYVNGVRRYYSGFGLACRRARQ